MFRVYKGLGFGGFEGSIAWPSPSILTDHESETSFIQIEIETLRSKFQAPANGECPRP